MNAKSLGMDFSAFLSEQHLHFHFSAIVITFEVKYLGVHVGECREFYVDISFHHLVQKINWNLSSMYFPFSIRLRAKVLMSAP